MQLGHFSTMFVLYQRLSTNNDRLWLWLTNCFAQKLARYIEGHTLPAKHEEEEYATTYINGNQFETNNFFLLFAFIW